MVGRWLISFTHLYVPKNLWVQRLTDRTDGLLPSVPFVREDPSAALLQGPQLPLRVGSVKDRNRSRVERETAKGSQQEQEQNVIGLLV